jgi:hypothetical protein
MIFMSFLLSDASMISVSSLDWSDKTSYPRAVVQSTIAEDPASVPTHQKFGVLMGSDLVYDPVAANLLADAVSTLLHNNR